MKSGGANLLWHKGRSCNYSTLSSCTLSEFHDRWVSHLVLNSHHSNFRALHPRVSRCFDMYGSHLPTIGVMRAALTTCRNPHYVQWEWAAICDFSFEGCIYYNKLQCNCFLIFHGHDVLLLYLLKPVFTEKTVSLFIVTCRIFIGHIDFIVAFRKF